MRPLGDAISDALGRVGITEESVSKWLGRPCGCVRRRRKLNRLSAWASEALQKTIGEARDSLGKLIGTKQGSDIDGEANHAE